jgi:hypothetical protein
LKFPSAVASRVTRWVCETIAQNVAKTDFCSCFTIENSSQKLWALLFFKKNYPT